MNVVEFVTKILEVCRGDARLMVKIDAGIPVPFEEVYKIKHEKGFLLFCPKEKDEHNSG